jgi:hypothetical protein
MQFTCPVCGEVMPQELVAIIAHGESHVVNEIKRKHPSWAKDDGLCQKCFEYYKDQIHPHPKPRKSRLSRLKENVLKRLKKHT